MNELAKKGGKEVNELARTDGSCRVLNESLYFSNVYLRQAALGAGLMAAGAVELLPASHRLVEPTVQQAVRRTSDFVHLFIVTPWPLFGEKPCREYLMKHLAKLHTYGSRGSMPLFLLCIQISESLTRYCACPIIESHPHRLPDSFV